MTTQELKPTDIDALFEVFGKAYHLEVEGIDWKDSAAARKAAIVEALTTRQPEPAGEAVGVPEAMQVVTDAMRNDLDYAWSWHCNIAMAAFDEGMDHYAANKAAARFLSALANVDTTKHQGFPHPPAAAPAPAVPQGWLPIETAPKDGTAVLVMRDIWPGTKSGRAEECNGHNTYVAEWWARELGDGGGSWMCYMDRIVEPRCPIEPTHWMPLPAPPCATQTPAPAQEVGLTAHADTWGISRAMATCWFWDCQALLMEPGSMPDEPPQQFVEWLEKQMPPETVILNPSWWALRIYNAVIAAIRAKGQV